MNSGLGGGPSLPTFDDSRVLQSNTFEEGKSRSENSWWLSLVPRHPPALELAPHFSLAALELDPWPCA